MNTKVAGHTPGSWHSRTVTVIRFDGDERHFEECHELANINTDETVAYVPIAADAVACPNGDANARLIAAAPELLGALRNAINALECSKDQTVLNTSATKAGWSAIAKAEGKE